MFIHDITPKKKTKQTIFLDSPPQPETKTKSRFQWLLAHTITVFSCVLIIALGIALLTHANPGTTTIGENISTGGNLTVGGNSTTTGGHYIGGNFSLLGNASTTGTFTLSGMANFLSDLIVGGNATTTGNFAVSGNTSLATTTMSGNLILQNLSIFPSTPREGQMFWSSASSTPYWYTGSQWKGDVSGATFVVAASDSKNKEKADYIGDGTADDVEIQAAIDALPDDGGAVVLLEGTYDISSSIQMKQNVTLRGQGKATKLMTTENINIITKGGSDSDDVIIENLFLYGDGDIEKIGQRGIAFDANRWIIRDNWIDNMGYDGIILYGDGHRVVNNVISNCKDDGINPLASSDGIIAGNYLTGMTYDGIHLSIGSRGYSVVGNVAVSNGRSGIYLPGDSAEHVISSNIINSNGASGIHIIANVDSINNLIIGNFIKNNTGSGMEINGAYTSIIGNYVFNNGNHGIHVRGDSCVVNNNTIINNTTRSIFLQSTSGTLVNGNKVEGGETIDTLDVNDCKIANNYLKGAGSSYGIRIRGTSVENIVYDNYVYNYPTGVNISVDTVSDTYIYDNFFKSNTTSISDSGTDTKINNNIGYTTENSSTTTVSSGNTYVDVSHSLDTQPATSTISIIPLEDLGNASTTNFWISDVGASTFRINVGTDPGKDVDFSWQIGSY